MTKYKLTCTRVDNGESYSQGIDINGQHYLYSEQGNVNKIVRRNAFTTLHEFIRERKKAPNLATLEIITE